MGWCTRVKGGVLLNNNATRKTRATQGRKRADQVALDVLLSSFSSFSHLTVQVFPLSPSSYTTCRPLNELEVLCLSIPFILHCYSAIPFPFPSLPSPLPSLSLSYLFSPFISFSHFLSPISLSFPSLSYLNFIIVNWNSMAEQGLTDTAFYLDFLSSYDYVAQQSQINSILALHPLPQPLPPRFKIRPMTPEDIPETAHILTHAFGENGMLNVALRNPNIARNINNWIARLRICLCDHCSFVVEDTEFSCDPGMFRRERIGEEIRQEECSWKQQKFKP